MIWQMVLLCIIWGTNWAVMSIALEYFPPILFSAFRFVLGSAVLLAICFYRKISLPKKQDWKWYALCGLLQTAYVFAVTQSVLEYLSIGVGSILAFSMPFWLTILAHFFIPNERINIAKISGLLIGLVGLFLVLDVNFLEMTWSGVTVVAQLFAISASVAWATSNIIIKKVLHSHDKTQFTTYQMVIGAFGLLIASFIMEPGASVEWNWIAVFCLVFAGVLASALAYILWSFILSKGEAGKSSISLLAVPIVGALSGWAFLGETLSLGTLLGILLVLSGIAVVNMKDIMRLRRKVVYDHAIPDQKEKGSL